MNVIQRLVDADRETPKTIYVVGDAMRDEYVTGAASHCQDGCLKFHGGDVTVAPGGAAGAVHQLLHWKADVRLLSPLGHPLRDQVPHFKDAGDPWGVGEVPVKRRYLDGHGRVLFRHDAEAPAYNLTPDETEACRLAVMAALREGGYDAVLFSDYDKGWLTNHALRTAIGTARMRDRVVVADPKRDPHYYAGAILKCNEAYAGRWHPLVANDGLEGIIVTRGPLPPLVRRVELAGRRPAVHCQNHVGAGDCFAAHFTLALAHGFKLEEAAAVAHAAARVYVQHPFGRPPWPHEVARDLDGVGGKVTAGIFDLARSFRASDSVVYTNGVFRLPHAGHAAMLAWAKAQGDVLVVGVNDDDSCARTRRGEYCRPLAERAAWLASLAAVDWVVPFAGDTPAADVEALRPAVLVKGAEYEGKDVPGAAHAGEVRHAPMYGRLHASEIIQTVKEHAGS